jgi:molecular chaperone DnaK (HSP70)
VASRVYDAHAIDVTKDAILAEAVERQCEKVKRALSAATDARYHLPGVVGTAGRKAPFTVQVSRGELRPVWEDLVQRAVAVASDAIARSGYAANQLSVISMIGGTSYVPQVREAVAQHFGRPLDVEIDPQTAVARGASLLAVFPKLIT